MLYFEWALSLYSRYAFLCREVLQQKKLPAIPVFLAEFAAPWIESFSRICGKRALYTRYSLHTLTSNSNFSSSKARTELGYFSRPADDTIRDMTGWIMEN